MNFIEYVALFQPDDKIYLQTTNNIISDDNKKYGELVYKLPNISNNCIFPELLSPFIYPYYIKLSPNYIKPFIHTFVLTTSIGTRLYSYSYTKYSLMSDDKLKIIRKQKAAQLILKDDIDELDNLPTCYYEPKTLIILSLLPYSNCFIRLLLEFCKDYNDSFTSMIFFYFKIFDIRGNC